MIHVVLVFNRTVSYGVYCLWTQVLWSDWNAGNGKCLAGWNMLDFVNWMCLVLITMGPAILLVFGVTLAICCAPCIFKVYREMTQNQREE